MFRYHYNTRTSLLCDILACDYLEYKLRFFISYNVYSLIYNIRILLSMVLSSSEKIVSLTKIFPCSNWFEREIFDMYGIKFTAHMDMRRILTDYGFQWHPLRKDFPLTGYIETHYSEKFKCVMHNNVNLIQDSHI
jgi:NADH-quinone oxidoreductase subunit C